MFNQLSIGLTALRAAQVGLDVVGQNLANANTPGYHRQVTRFVDRPSVNIYGIEQGTGVDVGSIDRVHSRVVEQAILQNRSYREQIYSQLNVARQIESVFAPRAGSLPDRLDDLFNRLEELSSRPHDSVSRRDVIRSASELSTTLGTLVDDLTTVGTQVTAELEGVVDRVNVLTQDIRDLNLHIRAAKVQGLAPNDLMDHRDALVAELASYVDVVIDYDEDSVIVAGGAVLVGGTTAPQFELRRSAEGLHLYRVGRDTPISLESGQLAASLETLNQTLPEYRERLDELSRGLIAVFDAQHVQGVGLDGPFHLLNGQRFVSDVTEPLAELPTAYPLSPGLLTVSIIDESTGERTLQRVSFDPAVDSVTTLAQKLQAIDHLQAVVDPQAGGLSLLAENGFAFDFTGLPQTVPDASGLSGTSTPRVGGAFQGEANGQIQVVFAGSGQIGVTPGLQIEILDAQGAVLQRLDVGEGYSPGSTLLLNNGLQLELDSGTVVGGESFSIETIADADETGALVALGLNTFFVGSGAESIAVRPDLLQSSDRLATSLTGLPGDGDNLTRLIARRELQLGSLGARTMGEAVEIFTAGVGSQVQLLTQATEGLDIVGQNLESQRASLSGVDPDEEVVHMLQFQRSYEAAARYLSTVNDTTQELMLLVQ